MNVKRNLLLLSISIMFFVHNSYSDVKNINEYFENITTMQADFEQINTSLINTSIDKSYGNFKIKKPDFLIWDINEPIKKKILIQKDKLMIYDSELNQLLISPIINEVKNSFLHLLLREKDISKDYEVNKRDNLMDDEFYTLESINNKNIFKTVRIYFRTNTLDKLIFISDNELVELKINNLFINKEISDNELMFEPPKNAEIIDQR